MGNPAKAFVFKALAPAPHGYQQSYPQKNWMTCKVVMDQPLKPHFDWRRLVAFAAAYYQRAAGEVALAALPPQLRDLSAQQLQRRLRKVAQPTAAAGAVMAAAPTLSAEQQAVMAQIRQTDGCFLLFGATGSGKTEVYLQCVHRLLEETPDAQALVMVPEINLTPQLEARFKARFGPLVGEDAVRGRELTFTFQNDQPAAPAQLAGGAPGHGTYRARHPHGSVRIDACAGADHRRRGTRPEL